ncbi:MAG: hypothetical protein U1E26_02580 [Coriobacteriia bacterium]|nr:hypothetical protein [Coriobacteriia bacterium]
MTSKKALTILVLVAVAALVSGLLATSAHSASSYTYRCDRCHSATGAFCLIVAESGSTADTVTYDVSVAQGQGAWAVFDNTRRVAGAKSASGSFTVRRGRPYDVIAVGPLLSVGHVKTRVSPPATLATGVSTATPDAIAPTTISDVRAVYGGPATIALTAEDNGGGWGLGYIYYQLNGHPIRMTTLLPGQRSHRVELPTLPLPATGRKTYELTYWSQDNYGNVEAQRSATFVIGRPTVTIKPSASTARVGSALTLSGVLDPGVAGTTIQVLVKKPGATRFVPLASAKTSADPSVPSKSRWSVSTKALRGTTQYYAISGTAKSAVTKVVGR